MSNPLHKVRESNHGLPTINTPNHFGRLTATVLKLQGLKPVQHVLSLEGRLIEHKNKNNPDADFLIQFKAYQARKYQNIYFIINFDNEAFATHFKMLTGLRPASNKLTCETELTEALAKYKYKALIVVDKYNDYYLHKVLEKDSK